MMSINVVYQSAIFSITLSNFYCTCMKISFFLKILKYSKPGFPYKIIVMKYQQVPKNS